MPFDVFHRGSQPPKIQGTVAVAMLGNWQLRTLELSMERAASSALERTRNRCRLPERRADRFQCYLEQPTEERILLAEGIRFASDLPSRTEQFANDLPL